MGVYMQFILTKFSEHHQTPEVDDIKNVVAILKMVVNPEEFLK
jgi:hypothetical protein